MAVAREALGEDLEGDVAAELRVAGAEDLSYPARAERCDDLVAAEARAEGKGHRGASAVSVVIGVRVEA